MNDKGMNESPLIRLGIMMGDGLHLEPGGKWIVEEYRKAMIAAGIKPPPKRRKTIDSQSVDTYMERRISKEVCLCGNSLKQTRKGSLMARCETCGKKYQLGKRKDK